MRNFYTYPPLIDDDDDDFENESLLGDVIDQKDDEGNSISTSLSDSIQSPNRDKSSLGKVMIESSQTTHERDSRRS